MQQRQRHRFGSTARGGGKWRVARDTRKSVELVGSALVCIYFVLRVLVQPIFNIYAYNEKLRKSTEVDFRIPVDLCIPL